MPQLAENSRELTGWLEAKYSLVRVLSLDIAAIAMGGGILAVRVIGSEPHRAFYVLLPLSVWVVYTLDHLLDGRRMGPNAGTPRHRFNYQHAKILWSMMTAVAGFCAIFGVIELSTPGIIFGGIIAGLFGVHELIVKLAGDRASPLLIKELGVAMIFTAGTWGLPLMRHRVTTGQWGNWPVEFLVQYLLLACVNLIEFSIYESKIDAMDGQTSFVQYLGRDRARRVALVMLFAQIPLAIYGIYRHCNAKGIAVEIMFLLMTLGLWAVLQFPRFAARQERYRAVGDGVFLLPLLAFFL